MQLSDSNIKLREELDQARNTTTRLNEEVLRLSGELNATRQRLDTKEKEWEERLKVHTIQAGDYCTVHTYMYICVYTMFLCGQPRICLHQIDNMNDS